MLENWLSPIDPSIIIGDNEIFDFSFINNIEIHDEAGMPNLKDTPLVILGLDHHANKIRHYLYQLSWHFGYLKCVDLGNLRNQDDNFITQILTELIDNNIFPIILGGQETKTLPQFLAHKGIRKYSNLALISERIPFHPNISSQEFFINDLLKSHQKHIFSLSFIGYQSHYCDQALPEILSEYKMDHLRLGAVKSEIEETEPLIRDADMLFFKLDAIKQTECPGVKNSSPNGLQTEEACQICKYAGMSDKLGSFSISGYYPKMDIGNQTARLIAQMSWYFIDGFKNRKKDYPVSNTDMTEYIIHYKDLDYQITFWKSNKSGRWWMQIPLKIKKDLSRHQLIPCSYKDYKLSCSGELPDRLLTALERIG